MSNEIADLLKEIEKLKEENKKIRQRKKYGLVWDQEKEPEKVVLDCQKNLPILKEIKDNAIIDTDENKPVNILIEGDNYHALQALNYTHKEKIDVIYIDPPYNKGKDFIYNDSIVDKDDSYRHSKWISFMEKRLKLAKNLLNETGIIFISIDDIEIAQLKLLCDEVFLEPNFLAKINRIVSKGSKNDSKYFVNDNDYILVYAKEKEKCTINPVSISVDILKFTKKDKIGYFKPRGLEMSGSGQDTLQHRPKMGYSIYYNDKNEDVKILFDYNLNNNPVYLEPDKNLIKNGYICIRPKINKGKLGRWRWGDKTFLKNLDDIYIDVENKRIYTKDRAKTESIIAPNCNIDILNTEGTKELKEIFGKNVFDFPKPSRLIKYLINRHMNKNAIILDFFAGSGTTAHSVLKLNNDDNTNRKFILCTNNENNICTDVCYERIKKLINGYNFSGVDKTVLYKNELTSSKIKIFDQIKNEVEEIKEKNKLNFDKIETKISKNNIFVYGIKKIKSKKEGLGGNLRYYKTEFIDIGNVQRITDKKKVELTHNAGELIAIKEEVFDEIEKNDWWQIFKSKDKTVAIYFREDQSDLNNLFKKLDDNSVLYLFSWGKNELKGEDYNKPNVKIKEIPQPIIEVYKEINKIW